MKALGGKTTQYPACRGAQLLTGCHCPPSLHAFRDLKAYVCTCGGPECDDAFFGDRSSWFEHELREHRAPYSCVLCGWGPRPRQELRIHISESHASFSSDQQKMLEDGGRGVASEFLARDCPFCDEWEEQVLEAKRTSSLMVAARDVSISVAQFERHVAIHQEELAIIAWPQATEEDETLSGSAATPPHNNRLMWCEFHKALECKETCTSNPPSH